MATRSPSNRGSTNGGRRASLSGTWYGAATTYWSKARRYASSRAAIPTIRSASSPSCRPRTFAGNSADGNGDDAGRAVGELRLTGGSAMRDEVPDERTPQGDGFGAVGRALLAATKNVAIAGGLVFVALVAMSIVSIVGRKLFAWPVPGDVELLQMCAAFASSAFFAYCHMANGDVKVDF